MPLSPLSASSVLEADQSAADPECFGDMLISAGRNFACSRPSMGCPRLGEMGCRLASQRRHAKLSMQHGGSRLLTAERTKARRGQRRFMRPTIMAPIAVIQRAISSASSTQAGCAERSPVRGEERIRSRQSACRAARWGCGAPRQEPSLTRPASGLRIEGFATLTSGATDA
jgi:hypothetical protein